MKRSWWLMWLAGAVMCLVMFVRVGAARADEGAAEGSADGSAAESAQPAHEGSAEPAQAAHEGSAEPAQPAEPAGAIHETEAQHDAEIEAEMDPPDEDADDGDPADGEKPTRLFDEDGDGNLSPEEVADEKEYEKDFAGISQTIDSDEVDQELEARPAAKQLLPSIGVDQFRAMVRIAKKAVLAKMEAKMEKAAAKKMKKFATGVVIFSLLGVLLLGMPLVLAKKYPGQGATLFKYSALAAATFTVTVLLFGLVLLGLRGVQAELGKQTNPTLAIAAGTFDTLDRHAEEYAVMGKELFAPTLEQLRGGEEQPAVLILQNGQKIVKKAMVFVSVAKMFKKVNFIFEVLPIILMGVTMLLFILAIRPTLTEIIRLPAIAAAGHATAGRDVIRNAMNRVKGELLATLCTIGVLAVITLVSGFVLGEIVAPAIDSLIYYFSMTVSYLQFVDDASSGLVFVTLFAVILFLVLNLAALILSTAFFLGRMQKIFQAKFTAGVPISTHLPWIKWAVPSVLWVQVFPWIFVAIAERVLIAINESVMSGQADANQVSWGKALIAGPAFLVLGFMILFWAARGLKAIGYLFKYKVVVPKLTAMSVPAKGAQV